MVSASPLVRITGSATFLGAYSVAQIVNNVDASSTYITRIALSGVNAGGDWNGAFGVLWGTAICGNDTIQGSVSAVPLPSSLPLFFSALSGLLLIRRKPVDA